MQKSRLISVMAMVFLLVLGFGADAAAETRVYVRFSIGGAVVVGG